MFRYTEIDRATRIGSMFADAFLVVTPGITIRDRLRVLWPSDPNNYYRELDIVPAEYRGDLGTARIVITNFHAFNWDFANRSATALK